MPAESIKPAATKQEPREQDTDTFFEARADAVSSDDDSDNDEAKKATGRRKDDGGAKETEDANQKNEGKRKGAEAESGSTSATAKTEETAIKKADETSQNKSTDEDEEVPLTFPQRLMEILTDKSNSNAIAWLPHGKGWVITDKKLFSTEVLPKYFSRKSKFTSFTRKLNRWNFTRVTRGPETGAYYHPLFRQDDQKLCLQMSSIHSKSPQQLQSMNPIALGMWSGDPNALQYIQYLQMFQQQKLYEQQQAQAVEWQRTQQTVPGTNQEGAGEQAAPTQKVKAEAKAPDSDSTGQMNNAAFMAYQAQYYAMMMAHQQQQQIVLGTTQLPQSPMLVLGGQVSHYQQNPLPLPPKPRKRQGGASHKQETSSSSKSSEMPAAAAAPDATTK